MYRNVMRHYWKEREILLIGKMLIEGYIQLRRVNIVHRDIRPGMIVFKEGFMSTGKDGQIRNNKLSY